MQLKQADHISISEAYATIIYRPVRATFYSIEYFRREGLISRQAFFEGIIREERNEFGNAIFSLVDPEDEETLEFG